MIHKVALVVDLKYGKRILPIADLMHVWVVFSAENMHAIELWYQKQVDEDYPFFQKGASSFEFDSTQSPEEIAANIIETIDDHHGPYWSEKTGQISEWSIIEIHGCKLKDPIKGVLESYGVDKFITTEFGFYGERK